MKEQKDNQLLFTDLCERLPYGIKAQVCERNDEDGSYFYNNCEILGIKSNSLVEFIRIDDSGKIYGRSEWFHISWFKPYLFPLSSMTEEQKREYNSLCDAVPTYHYEFGDIVEDIELCDSFASIDYLNKNHFDYRGLIEKELAIDATGLNIY